MRKGFDKDTYNKYDSIAKNALSNWLESNGYKDIDSKETYGVDIICKDKDDIECYFETEVKTGWGDWWPKSWKEIRIPYRKRRLIDKWAREGSLGSLTFVIFNKTLDQGWFMDGKTVNESAIKPVDNIMNTNELFFHIKVADAKLVNMKENTHDKDLLINSKYPS